MNKTRMSEQQNCILVNGCFVDFSLLAQIYRSCFGESFDSHSKDNCCGISSLMTELGRSLNSVVVLSSIHTVLSVWLMQQITGIGSDHIAFCFNGQSYLVRVSDVLLSCMKAVIGKYRAHRTVTSLLSLDWPNACHFLPSLPILLSPVL